MKNLEIVVYRYLAMFMMGFSFYAEKLDLLLFWSAIFIGSAIWRITDRD